MYAMTGSVLRSLRSLLSPSDWQTYKSLLIVFITLSPQDDRAEPYCRLEALLRNKRTPITLHNHVADFTWQVEQKSIPSLPATGLRSEEANRTYRKAISDLSDAEKNARLDTIRRRARREAGESVVEPPKINLFEWLEHEDGGNQTVVNGATSDNGEIDDVLEGMKRLGVE